MGFVDRIMYWATRSLVQDFATNIGTTIKSGVNKFLFPKKLPMYDLDGYYAGRKYDRLRKNSKRIWMDWHDKRNTSFFPNKRMKYYIFNRDLEKHGTSRRFIIDRQFLNAMWKYENSRNSAFVVKVFWTSLGILTGGRTYLERKCEKELHRRRILHSWKWW